MNILAIDPGKMTGFAKHTGGRFEAWAEPYDVALSNVMYGITGDPDDVPPWWSAIVMEDFIISQRTIKTGTANWRRGAELEFIGAVRWGCAEKGIEFVTQTPAQAKSFSTDAKLRKMGWWVKGLDHPRDASRHLMLYMVSRNLIDPRQLLEKA